MRVSHVLDLLSVGFYIAKILEEYPQLTREDILACMAYGAEMSRERFVDMSLDPQSEYIRISSLRYYPSNTPSGSTQWREALRS